MAAQGRGPADAEALAYFRDKDIRPSFSYKDVTPQENAFAFTVAKMTKLDLLDDTKAAMDSVLSDGKTFREFAQELKPQLEKKGWWGRKQMIDPKTGKVREVQLGSSRRLRTIYDANLRAARAAGQWQRIQRTKRYIPYLLYQLGPSVHHRVQHVAWEGTLLPVDDPFWSEAYPPQGYGCKCWVRQVGHEERARLISSGYQDPLAPQAIDPTTGLPTGHLVQRNTPVKIERPAFKWKTYRNRRTGRTVRVPEGVDPAWQGNTGQNRVRVIRELLAEKISSADQQLARQAVRSIVTSPVLPEYIDEVAAKAEALRDSETPAARAAAKAVAAPIGELPIGMIDRDIQKVAGSTTQLVRLSPETLAKQLAHHPEIDAGAYRSLDWVLRAGTVIRQTDQALIFFGRDGSRIYRAVLKTLGAKGELYLLSFHPSNEAQLKRALRDYELVRRGG